VGLARVGQPPYAAWHNLGVSHRSLLYSNSTLRSLALNWLGRRLLPLASTQPPVRCIYLDHLPYSTSCPTTTRITPFSSITPWTSDHCKVQVSRLGCASQHRHDRHGYARRRLPALTHKTCVRSSLQNPKPKPTRPRCTVQYVLLSRQVNYSRRRRPWTLFLVGPLPRQPASLRLSPDSR
jgi:hypothetical protein